MYISLFSLIASLFDWQEIDHGNCVIYLYIPSDSTKESNIEMSINCSEMRKN